MTREPATPETAAAQPPSGAIQRMAAEMLDVLAEHLDQQPADLSLTVLLARSTEGAVDAHGLAPNPWIRDGIETVALLGLAITALPLRVSQLRRDQLAARFDGMALDRQRTWVINAADVLHRSNAVASYGPTIGQLLMPEARQAEDPTNTARREGADHWPAADHVHEQGLHTQFLPACLQPADADRAAHPDLALPGEGDPVVIANGHVMFLTATDGAALFTSDSNQLWAVPVIGDGCGAARWDPESVMQIDLTRMSFPHGDAEAMESAWTLLFDFAAQHEAGGRNR